MKHARITRRPDRHELRFERLDSRILMFADLAVEILPVDDARLAAEVAGSVEVQVVEEQVVETNDAIMSSEIDAEASGNEDFTPVNQDLIYEELGSIAETEEVIDGGQEAPPVDALTEAMTVQAAAIDGVTPQVLDDVLAEATNIPIDFVDNVHSEQADGRQATEATPQRADRFAAKAGDVAKEAASGNKPTGLTGRKVAGHVVDGLSTFADFFADPIFGYLNYNENLAVGESVYGEGTYCSQVHANLQFVPELGGAVADVAACLVTAFQTDWSQVFHTETPGYNRVNAAIQRLRDLEARKDYDANHGNKHQAYLWEQIQEVKAEILGMGFGPGVF